ncbi:MAG: hypothetical protein COX77_01070 [Candidatus Komeilibacteria bacterium CG_4_10_14_0_2_um_filter_37_10]|uniref:Uncharacterized protein n=1 Tax=Candidatus Komeilibacteria bacterium CG_4_10_14_0_2_um_filter_37_10 TaxID=1974470 RepID=A0A2M7VG11_9BACT|nr:MAG: hypothetical protein COX77_01070 [Candidatus Komeilibacteria bacterium CG_4_10_14_0_2_um_filter_37_10]
MHTQSIQDMVNRTWARPIGEDIMRKAVTLNCQNFDNLTAVQVINMFRSIQFETVANEKEKSEYWITQSPFNNKWYIFLILARGSWPTIPIMVLNTRPKICVTS